MEPNKNGGKDKEQKTLTKQGLQKQDYINVK